MQLPVSAVTGGAAHTQEGPKARGLSTHLQARAKCALVGGGMLRIVNPLALQGIEIAAPDDAHPWAVACRPSIYRNRDCCAAGTASCNRLSLDGSKAI